MGEERSSCAPQCSNLEGFVGTRNPTFGAPGRGAPKLSSCRSVFRRSTTTMSDARRARAERRATLAARIAQTAPVGGPSRRAATGPARNEQQASSLHPSVRQDGRTATPSLTPAGSSSHARRARMDVRGLTRRSLVLIYVGSRVPAKPSRFKHWGAHEYLPLPIHALASLRSQGLTRRTRNTRDTRFILVRATVVL